MSLGSWKVLVCLGIDDNTKKRDPFFCGVTFVGGTSIHVQLDVCQSTF